MFVKKEKKKTDKNQDSKNKTLSNRSSIVLVEDITWSNNLRIMARKYKDMESTFV